MADRLGELKTVHVSASADYDVVIGAGLLDELDTFVRPFCGRFGALTFRAAIACAKDDPFVRLAARAKADALLVFGGGRGAALQAATDAYRAFLLALAQGEADEESLKDLLETADGLLNVAFAEAKDERREGGLTP